MCKKILLIIICCLPLVTVSAQTRSDINNLLDSITKSIDKIAKDKNVSASCNDTIKHYKKGFAQKDILSWNKTNITLLMQHAEKFIASVQPKGKIICNDKQIKKLLGNVKELTIKLKAITILPPANNQPVTQKSDSAKSMPAFQKVDSSSATASTNVVDSDKGDNNNIPVTAAGNGLQQDNENSSAQSMLLALTAMVVLTVVLTVLYIKKRSDYNLILKKLAAINNGGPVLAGAENTKKIAENIDQQTRDTEPVPAAVSEDVVALPGLNQPETVEMKESSPDSVTRITPEDAANTEIDLVPAVLDSRENTERPVIEALENTSQANTDTIAHIIIEPVAASPETENIPATAQPMQRSFLCELMMTAGPRKKFMGEENADKDLGEDICGFVSDTNEVLIWLLDGTSDLHCLKDPVTRREYFSSRLLALGIAENLKSGFAENSTQSIKEMVDQGIKKLKETWLQRIDLLPAEEKLLLKNNIEKKNFPECAATILIARLTISGAFTAYRSGDSKMILFSTNENGLGLVDSPLDQKNDESNDRIFFRLRLTDEEKFDIIYNDPLHEIIEKENISTIISFSDGIGMNTEQVLIEEYKSAPDQIRKEIMYESQETGDDKSICFIEIKETR